MDGTLAGMCSRAGGNSICLVDVVLVQHFGSGSLRVFGDTLRGAGASDQALVVVYLQERQSDHNVRHASEQRLQHESGISTW